ncbi:MAG: ABC transporter transmembrane domain-containing protein [Rhodospirillales bacterium]
MDMDKTIFHFIWRNSKGQQILLLVMTACSFPFLLTALKLPKIIINDAIDGKDFPKEYFGIEFGQIEFLLALCAALFALIMVNIMFSRTINTHKGVSSERLLRRLRYQLYERIMRFPQSHFQKVTPSELASMITAEVEPLGFFIGESFAQPMVQGGTMVTILFFMITENPILGLVAVAMVPVQAYVIPKLQRRVTSLGRERVTKARHLAGRVGESVLGISDVHTHDASNYMLAELSRRLNEIFTIRHEIYQRKFFMKGLNNFLNQVTPLIFYSVGGVLIINGDLSLGALVAVLAAYARFTTPWKELLKYYERLQDARIKYEQLIEQFQPGEMMEPALQRQRPETITPLKDAIELRNVSLTEDGIKALDGISFKIDLGKRAGIVADPGARDKLAHVMARLIQPTSGSIVAGETNLSALPEAVTGAVIGYAGAESYIFDGTVEDNLLYGLKHAPVDDGDAPEKNSKEYEEAIASGNSTHDLDAEWIDYQSLGLSSRDDLDAWMLKVSSAVELDNSLNARSLSMELDPATHPALAEKLLEARRAIGDTINADPDTTDLVYPFEADQYNANASVGENLVFGEPVDDEFDFKTLGAHAYVRSVLDQCELTDRFVAIGQELSQTLIEMFGGLAPDEPLFEQYSFVDEETLESLKKVVGHVGREGPESLTDDDKSLLISLTFQVIVVQHRFGVIDDAIQERIVAARKVFRENLPEDKQGKIAFIDKDTFSARMNIRRNLLMGTVNDTVPNAEERVNEILFEALDKMGLKEEMIRYATAAQVGVGGSRLSQVDRQKIAVARSLIKRPSVLVLNDPLGAMDREAQGRVRRNMYELLPETTFAVFLGEVADSAEFDQVLTIHNGRLVEGAAPEAVAEEEAVAAADDKESASTINAEAAVLANIPLFAGINAKNLKLLAFSSQRITFKAGENLIKQNQPGEAAYVLLDGEVEVVLGEGADELVIARKGEHTLLGELSLLSGTTATATVRAATPVTALKVKKEVFLELIEGDAIVASHVARVVSDKLVESLQLLAKAA